MGGAPNMRLNAKRNEMSELNPQAAEISDIGLFVFARSRFASSIRTRSISSCTVPPVTCLNFISRSRLLALTDAAIYGTVR